MDITVLKDSILELALVAIGLVITRFLVPYLKEKYTAEKVKNVYDIIVKAVQAAEKIYQEHGQGLLKKEYVVDYIKKIGITLSEDDLNVLIESAVKTLDMVDAEIKK